MYVSHTDPHSSRKKSIHFACQFEALGSEILQIRKQFQNPKSLRILELFSDLHYSTSKCLKLARKVKQHFSSRHHTDPHSRQEMLIHFACQLEDLEVEYRESKNSSGILRLRILELSLDLRYSTSKCLKLTCKVNKLFPARLCEDLCVGACKVYIDLCHPEYTKTPSNLGECSYFFIEKLL